MATFNMTRPMHSAHGVGMGRGGSAARARSGRAVDADNELVGTEWLYRRLVFGIGVDDEGTGNDDRFVAVFDDVAPRRSDHGAGDS